MIACASVMGVTTFHEIGHLVLRSEGKMRTPDKLLGLYVPEAGEYLEKLLFGGIISFRLSNDKTSRGWDPTKMRIKAVILRQVQLLKSLSDSEITAMCSVP